MKVISRLAVVGIVAMSLSSVSNAHRIQLVAKSWSFDPPYTTGNGVATSQSGSVAPDDGKAIRVAFQAQWSVWLFPGFNWIGTAQQSGKAIYTLKWIPDSKTDVPGITEYSLLVEVQRALGSDSSGNFFPPGYSSTSSTVQSWLGSKQTYWPAGPTNLGLPWNIWPDDPSQYRELAASAFPCPVTFHLQGRDYIGIAELPSSYNATFTGTCAFGQGSIVDYASIVIRGKALECAGVPVELP